MSTTLVGTEKKKTRGGKMEERRNSELTFKKRGINQDNKEQSYTCKKCNTDIESTQQSVGCELCGTWFHAKCVGLSETLFKAVRDEATRATDDSGLHWFCPQPCNKLAKKFIHNFGLTEERVTTLENQMKEIQNKINKLETGELPEQMMEVIKDMKSDDDKIRKIVKDVIEGDDTTVPKVMLNEASGKSTVTSVLSEVNDRREREQNLIIFGVKESNSDNKQERIQHDLEKIKEIGNICDVKLTDSDMTKTVRLGKFNTESKERPILATVASLETKKKILKGAWKLSKLNKEPNSTRVRIANDLTKTEREQEKQLYVKAKEMQENESGEYLFKVRGPPWARKIVKVKKYEK